MGFIPLPIPDVIAYTEGEAAHPELWDKLRGCWVPGLFAGPVWDFSESKDGSNIDSAFRTKALGIRTGIQSGEELDGTTDYFSVTMRQEGSSKPVGGWTLVMKLRRFLNTPAASAQGGIAHFGASSATSFYPFTDGNLYIDLLATSRVLNGTDPESFDRTKWHDLTITSISGGSSTDWNCYQAGLKIGTGTPGDWFFDNVNDLTIGASRAVINFFPGQIRHVLLYNRILDLETIQRLDNDPFYTPYAGIDVMAFAKPAAPSGINPALLKKPIRRVLRPVF